jgi:hypothetical protein
MKLKKKREKTSEKSPALDRRSWIIWSRGQDFFEERIQNLAPSIRKKNKIAAAAAAAAPAAQNYGDSYK